MILKRTIKLLKEYLIGLPVGIAGSSLTLIFTIGTGINKSLLRVTNKTKKETQENNCISKK